MTDEVTSGQQRRREVSHCHHNRLRVPIVTCVQEQPSCLARRAVSARSDVGRGRRQLRALLRARDARRALPVRLGRRGDGIADDSAAGADRHGVARLPARRAARASSTAIASTARTSRTHGHRFNPHKLLLDPYAKAIGARRAGTTRSSATASAIATIRRSTTATAPPYAPARRVVDDAFTWGDDRAAAERRGTRR